MEQIVNKVAESGLIGLDLAKFKPTETVFEIDIADQLWQGFILKEKDFRAWVKDHDWNQYSDQIGYITCSADAIVPTWAFMLVASKLVGIVKFALVGDRNQMEKEWISKKIQSEPIESYIDGRIIIKGCSDIPNPDYAMVKLIQHLQPHAKSIMYGEPCSTVPLYKRPK
ncbi:MAG: hypothetical protein ACI9XP_000563 [Lentimonas sp.]|jgi:hypothetical protein